MSNFKEISMNERIFYLFIIFIQLLLVMVFFNNNSSTAEPENKNLKQIEKIYSFKGFDLNKKEKFFHFTSHSNKFFVFIRISNKCKHCISFLNNLKNDIVSKDVVNIFDYYVLTDYEIENPIKYPELKFLKIDNNDIFQFGEISPTIYTINGKGEILFSQIGYSKDIIEKILNSYENYFFKKSIKL